jgi:hypothetical protein
LAIGLAMAIGRMLRPDQILGLADMAMQVLSMLTLNNLREPLQALRSADEPIQPHLGGFLAAAWSSVHSTCWSLMGSAR